MNWDKDLRMMMHMREVRSRKEQMNRKERMNKEERMNKKERMSRKVQKVVWEELMAPNKVLDVRSLIDPDRVHNHRLVVVVGERLVEEYVQGKDHERGNHNRNCNHHICHTHHNDRRGREEGDHDHEDKAGEEICLEVVGEEEVYDDHQNHDHLDDLYLFLWVVHVLMNDHYRRLLSY
jgi:hypothetical protein